VSADNTSVPAAVLFDMDGLLVSTEETWYSVETEIMAGLGAPWGPEHQERLVGGPLERSAAYMVELAGRSDVTTEAVGQALLDGMVRHLRAGEVHWMPGARELLVEVTDAGIPAALVSSSYRCVVDAVLDAIGHERFAVTISADDVPRTKPHPDPYLAAAQQLGVDVRQCVALEDSPTGAVSARAAGAITVAVPGIATIDAAAVDAVVASLDVVDLAFLRALLGRDGAQHVKLGGASRGPDRGDHPDHRSDEQVDDQLPEGDDQLVDAFVVQSGDERHAEHDAEH
jgi:HAD superfamily hydrolase (TIGR01509 family)